MDEKSAGTNQFQSLREWFSIMHSIINHELYYYTLCNNVHDNIIFDL